ncbi:MAG TPA: tetratricopeptide repeat protein [Acidimicrobiales bacterium]|nr:tetratricopeptide repeat protein [Acidimicrobiales bacterium]
MADGIEVALPEGVVTFLFTDIEGSTHLIQKHGDAWADLLTTHYELLDAPLRRYGGSQVGTRGDAVFVAFESAADALAGAVEAQAAVSNFPWPDPQLRVRMGLHTGEAVVRNGDYVGLAVHEAARICSAGHGGQVLCSASTLHHAGGPPPRSALVDLGKHRLRDLPSPTHLWQLSRDDLRSQFPGVRADAVPGNLPKPITSFIGRGDERADAAERIRGGAKLVTITGTGGSGKTRLALQIASEVVDAFPHGAWLVELAGLADGPEVPDAVANSLDLRENNRPTNESLARALANRDLLLVLDNCEHLLGPVAALVEALCTHCPQLVVLATSQEALGIPGESVLSVGSMADAEALQLFVDRAAERRPGFALIDANFATVSAICRRLDGIPLAIELAAGRVAAFSVYEIADRLNDQFRLLTGGSRAAMARQQTLRATVDWSYGLLEATEQTLFARLAAFSGGWDLEAAVAVAGFGGLADLDVVDGLGRLVARSLVVVEEQDDRSRYRMLSVIKQYALERLKDGDELVTTRDRHATFFRALALRAEPELTGPSQAAWLERLASDEANLRACLDWLGSAALEPAVALWRYWLVRGDWDGGRRWIEQGLDDLDGVDQHLVARALDAAGALATEQGDYNAAEQRLNAALARWRSLDDAGGTARTLNHLGALARNRFAYDEARAQLNEALHTATSANDDRHRAIALRNLGTLASQQGDPETAGPLYEAALEIARIEGDKRVIATLTHALSRVAFDDGNRTVARALADEGHALARDIGDRRMLAEHLTVMAGLATADGDEAAASARLEEALALWQRLGSPNAVAWLHTTLGEMALTDGDAAAARRHFDQAADAWRDSGDEPALARALNLAGWSALEARDYDVAEAILDDAVVRARAVGDDAALSATLHSRGELARRTGDRTAARHYLEESLALARSAGWRNLLWWPTWSMAALSCEEARLDEADALIGQAEALSPKIGRAPRLADCREQQARIAEARGDLEAAKRLDAEATQLRSGSFAVTSAD